MTYRQLRNNLADKLKEAGIEEYAYESMLILMHVCNEGRSFFLLHDSDQVEEETIRMALEFLEKRERRIPFQHITGYTEFMGYEFAVNENVLIPRQDTETVVEVALSILPDFAKVLDMCTGSGCIAVSISKLKPDCRVYASDISEKALETAVFNAANNKADVEFIQSDLFENITDRFDLIISNPPYIPSRVIPTLMPEVRDHEPILALDGTEDGLYFYRKIAEQSVSHLNEGGILVFEIGHDQGLNVPAILRENGFQDVQLMKDLAGLDRIVTGRR